MTSTEPRYPAKAWSEQDRADLLKMRAANNSWEVIGQAIGHSPLSCRTSHYRFLEEDRAAARGEPRREKQAARIPWSAAEIATMTEMREIQRMKWADIDRAMGRAPGSSCGKYEGQRRGRAQVSKYGGGGRIEATQLLADRDARKRLEPASLTAAIFGDPLPGRSALDRKREAGA